MNTNINLKKNNKNFKELANCLCKLGCPEKGESFKFNEKGWSNQKITCPSPKHPDNNPSANFNSKSKTIYCHVCEKSWSLEEALKLYEKKNKQMPKTSTSKEIKKPKASKFNKPVKKSVKRLSKKQPSQELDLPLLSPKGYLGVFKGFVKANNIVAAYPYTDEDGLIEYYKFRKNPKSFLLGRIERWVVWGDDCDLELQLNMRGIKKWFPYNLPKVLKAENIIIAEGEKDCDNLQQWLDENGFDSWAATTFIITDKKRISLCCQYLKNKTIYLCADIDGPEKNFKGEKYMHQTVGPIVSKMAKSTKVLELQLKSGEDVSDLIKSNPKRLLRNFKKIDIMPNWHLNYFIDDPEIRKEVLDINKTHAVVRAAPKTVILCENNTSEKDDRPFILYDIKGIREYYRNKQIPNPEVENDKRYKSFINPLDYWMNWPGRRTYSKIVFDPSGKVKPNEYNIWQGFISVKGAKKSDLILKHIFEIAVRENKKHFDWLIDWFADIIQNPSAEPRGTAIVLKGGRGSGKSIIGDYIGKIFGSHYQLIDNPDHIFGKFNYHLTQKLFVQIEEAVWGGDKTREGKLKSLITNKVMPVEIKFGDIFSTRNYLRMMITSNEDWVVPSGPNERRFFVLKTNDKYQKRNDEKYRSHNEKCRKYFDALVAEMENGGPEALLEYLKKRKIKSDLRFAPHTEALAEQKMLSMDSVHQWLYSRIFEDERLIDRSKKWGGRRDNEWEQELQNDTEYIINKLQKNWTSDPVPYEIIYYDFYNFEKKAGKGRFSTTKKTFSQKLKEILGIDNAKQKTILIDDDDDRYFSRKRRIMCIEFPTLEECKRIFYEKTGIKAEL